MTMPTPIEPDYNTVAADAALADIRLQDMLDSSEAGHNPKEH